MMSLSVKKHINRLQKSVQGLQTNYEFVSPEHLDELGQNERVSELLENSLNCVNDLNKVFQNYKKQEEKDEEKEKTKNFQKSMAADPGHDSLIDLDNYQNIPKEIENDLSFDLDLEEELQSEVSLKTRIQKDICIHTHCICSYLH